MKKYGYRLSLIELSKRENYSPNITYYVNVKSSPDINNQSILLYKDIMIKKNLMD